MALAGCADGSTGGGTTFSQMDPDTMQTSTMSMATVPTGGDMSRGDNDSRDSNPNVTEPDGTVPDAGMPDVPMGQPDVGGSPSCEGGDACYLDPPDDCGGDSSGRTVGCEAALHLDILETTVVCGPELRVDVLVAGKIPATTIEDDEVSLLFDGPESTMLLCRVNNDAEPWSCTLNGSPVDPGTQLTSSGNTFSFTVAEADLAALEIETITVLTYAYDSGDYLEDDTDAYSHPC